MVLAAINNEQTHLTYIETRTNEPMDPRLLLQLSAKNNQRKTYIFEQDEGGLSKIIYLTTLWVILIPSVTFEPLCTLKFMQNIRKKYDFHV